MCIRDRYSSRQGAQSGSVITALVSKRARPPLRFVHGGLGLFVGLARIEAALEGLAKTLARDARLVAGAPRFDLDDAHLVATSAVAAGVSLGLVQRLQLVFMPSPQKRH